ncbi:MAG: hypothetical protein WD004_06170 [Actinomycetota bacterium]
MEPLGKFLEEEVAALEEGEAFADLTTDLRSTSVTGTDAETWLNDLVTAGVAGMESGQARRSLLLTPTGRIRSDFHVARTDQGYVLLQDRTQPEQIGELLAKYVLSSDVALADADDEVTLFAVPTGTEVHDAAWTASPWEPFGQLVATPSDPEARFDLIASLTERLVLIDDEALDVWRIRHGIARFPIDLTAESLPAEDPAAEATIDADKGCFLGQESVAKIRNFGRPPFVITRLWTHAAVGVGQAVFTDGAEVGVITSAVPDPPTTKVLARVRNSDSVERTFHTADGEPLDLVLPD